LVDQTICFSFPQIHHHGLVPNNSDEPSFFLAMHFAPCVGTFKLERGQEQFGPFFFHNVHPQFSHSQLLST
jgi:hypothetical protein